MLSNESSLEHHFIRIKLTNSAFKIYGEKTILAPMLRCLFTFVFFTALQLSAQTAFVRDSQQLSAFRFRNIGPAGMSGRITSIAVVNNKPQIIYAGAASGGIWKSDNGGIAWIPVFDKADVNSIGALAVQQSNPDVVWAGTGEGNPRNSHNSGKGIYKSMDAGKTWIFMGLAGTKTIHRIVIDPLNADVVYVAAMGSIWGPNEERGVYKTTDGGKTWNRILFSNNLTGCAELIMDPANPNKLFAAMWEYQRKPYHFNSGGKGSGLFMTIDGGKTWKKAGTADGLPEGTLGRIGIAMATNKPNKVYAIVESKTLDFYASDDGGYKWKKVSSQENMGNRPFYYNEIYVDPKNENRIYSMWSQVSRSEDGGKTWQILADWGHIHPDHHAFYINPDNPDMLINGNDGGLNISYDGGTTWRFAENIPVGQFYHVSVDEDIPYHVYGGLQDNGSWRGPGFAWNNGRIQNSDWQELLFGDGFDVLPIPGNSNAGYAMWQGGNLYRYDLKSGRSRSIKPEHPEGKYLRFNWNAAIAPHPFNSNGLYYGSQFLHKSMDGGLSWKIISPDLTTNDTAKLHQAQSGGLTIDATNAENHCTIISIAASEKDSNVIWVGTDDGNVQLTKDGGKTWLNLTAKIAGLPKAAWIPFIHVSTVNAGEAWVVVNNYRNNDYEPYLFRTTDYGTTWNRLLMGSKVSGHCLSVLPMPGNENLVFLGTDHGLWLSFNAGKEWKRYPGFPACPVQDMKFQKTEGDLVIGTFGRGIWILDDVVALSKLHKNGLNTNGGSIKILNSTHGYLANYIQPSGARFGADAMYGADNKAFGSMITWQTAGTKNVKSGKWEKSKFSGKVYDKSGKLVRSFRFSADSAGIYRMHWRLNADGFRFPSHYTPEADAVLPEGLTVAPGIYKLVLSGDQTKDSALIEVKETWQEKYNDAAEQQRRLLYIRLKTNTERAFKAYEALKEAEKTIEMVLGARYADDSATSKLKKLSGPVKDSILKLKELFLLPRDFRGYEDATVRLSDRLYAAMGYIQSMEMPGQNAEISLKNAESETDRILKRVNDFFSTNWSEFRASAEKEKLKPFKELGGY
jgi:photosystem II stability/assembly factor-like uncharacterized protein